MEAELPLDKLRAKRDEVLARSFPLTADLPDEYDDLYAEWVESKEPILHATEAMLKGDPPDTTMLKRTNLARVWRRLARLRAEHPSIADMYAEPFRCLQVLLDLLLDQARVSPAKGS